MYSSMDRITLMLGLQSYWSLWSCSLPRTRQDSVTYLGSKESYSVWKVRQSAYTCALLPKLHANIAFFSVRGIGTSCATAMNWAANLLINSTYLSLMSTITPSGAFGFYAGLCLLGWLFCIFCFPETAGLSLEEVKLVFTNGFGLKESARLRKEKRWLKEEQYTPEKR